jgi:cytoskeletal protein RodZ
MNPIGEVLSQERKRQEKTIKDAERATKIRGKYLQAIEDEDFNTLPGRAYTIAFIRGYASFLELDSDPLVNEFKVREEPSSKPKNVFLKDGYKVDFGSRQFLIFLVVVGGLFFLIWLSVVVDRM